MPEYIRTIIFYGVFILIIVLYGLIYGAYYFGYSDISGSIMALILSSAPYVSEDLSLAGEITPPLLAGFMSATLPHHSVWVRTILCFVLAAICYILYLHLTVFLNTAQAAAILQGVSQDPRQAVPVLSAFSGGVRTFAAIVAAAVLGLQINRGAARHNPEAEA